MAINKLKLKNYNIFFIEESDYTTIEAIIKESLIGLCWGTENEEIYDIKEVVEEFLIRFNKKSSKQKFGYIGEFLYYLCVLQNQDVLKPVSLFFNQEERGFKKGFDLLGYDGNEFWYSEVKSGSKDNKDIDEFNLERLNTAYNDIIKKITNKNRNKNYWDTAKSNICKIKFSGGQNERKKICEVLNEDRKKEEINNLIIVSVVFDNSKLPLNLAKIQNKYKNLKNKKENISVVCIRKKTIEKVINILQGVVR